MATNPAWMDRLQRASLRGVPFYVESHEADLGRRVQLHEYPLRDEPFAEDLGRKKRSINVEAFVLGGDYMSQRDALLAAIEKPGPAKLVHPYLGELQVSVLGAKLRESNAEGGMARIALELVEAGTPRFPAAVVSTSAAVGVAADSAIAAVQAEAVARIDVTARPAFVAQGVSDVMTTALGQVSVAAGRVQGATGAVAALRRDVDAFRRDVLTLVYTPADAVQGLLSAVRQPSRSVATTPRDALSLARTLYRFGTGMPAVGGSTPNRQAQAAAQQAVVRLMRVAGAAEAARAAADVEWESYQEAIAARDELVDALDDVMLTPGLDDALFDALRGLRAAVVRDIAAKGADLARLVTWTPVQTMPMLVIAQQVYGDATRADEMVARNRVRHPLFVPGAMAIEVLADG